MIITTRHTLTSLGVLFAVVLATLTMVHGAAISAANMPATAAPAAFTAEEVIAQITAADGAIRFDVAEDGTASSGMASRR